MSEMLKAFSFGLMKVASDDKKKKRPSYPSQVLALAPAAALSSAFDYPKGYLDKKIESKITKIPASAGKSGLGRATGRFGASLITTPMFISGIKDLKNAKNERERNIGLAKVVGSGATYSAIKGGIEAAITGGDKKKILKKVKDVATVRGGIGTLAAASTGLAIANNMKKNSKKESPSLTDKYIKPSIAGAAVGGLKGGAEVAYLNRKQLKRLVKNPRGYLGPMAGRATAGGVGAVLLSEIAKRTMDKVGSEKPEDKVKQYFETPSSLYYKTKARASKLPDARVYSEYQLALKGDAEKTPTSRAIFYALHEDLVARGHDLPRPKLMDKVRGPDHDRKAGGSALVATTLLAPHFFDGLLSSTPETQRDLLVRDALDAMASNQGVTVFSSKDGDFWNRSGLDKKIGAHMGRFDDGKKYVATPSGRPEIMAHELGHAFGDRKFLQGALSKDMFALGKTLNILLPAAVVATSLDRSFATPEELEAKKKFVVGAGVIGTALMSPRLLEEGMASAQALDILMKAQKNSGATDNIRDAIMYSAKKGTKLLPSFGTYAAPAAVPFIIAKYLGKGKEDERTRNRPSR